ncbi:hypothetical protein Pla52nx_000380 [Stieleria varia]|uniref:hypothetical protein n=1 Tax=Stieleria varia TaxID=2528005 RepID=UPI0018D23607
MNDNNPPQFKPDRRHFLAALAGVSLTSATASRPLLAAEAKTTLAPSGKNDLVRVRVEMDVKGNVKVPENPLVSRTSQVTVPIKSDVVFDYEERYRRPDGAAPTTDIKYAERFYHTAQSTSTLNREESTVQLRESVRQTIVRRETSPEVIYSSDDYFTHEELGLLRTPICSVGIDQLLPTTPVAPGDKYRPTDAALISVLNLSGVDVNEVTAEIAEIATDAATIEIKGNLDGSVEGVPTKLRLVGKLRFDREAGMCTWLAMAIHETREIGNAEPGFDVAATIKLMRQPMDETVGLPKTPAKVAWNAPIPEDRLFVDLQSRHLGIGALMDRRWRMMSDVTGSAMMRLIENDKSVAQCNFRSLARLKPGQQWTLEAFEAETKRTIGKPFTQMVEADQRLSAQGLRVLRLVADGMVEGVPIRWISLHFSDDQGRRVLATFTMSGNQVAAFAGTDAQLADSLRMLETESAKAVATTASGSPQAPAGSLQGGGADSLADPGQETPSIARLPRTKRSGSGNVEVQSASDLR